MCGRMRSAELVAAEAFADGRYAGARRTGTAIYYLLEPETFSEMHRLRSDEVFHFYAGDAVEMLQLTGGWRRGDGGDWERSDAGREAAGSGGAGGVAGISAGGRGAVGVAGMYGESGV